MRKKVLKGKKAFLFKHRCTPLHEKYMNLTKKKRLLVMKTGKSERYIGPYENNCFLNLCHYTYIHHY